MVGVAPEVFDGEFGALEVGTGGEEASQIFILAAEPVVTADFSEGVSDFLIFWDVLAGDFFDGEDEGVQRMIF